MATRPVTTTPDVVMAEGDGEEKDRPSEHIIVGVDIGYTCTGKHVHIATYYQILTHVALALGVAICSTDRHPNEPICPIPIQKWPGGDTAGTKVTNKVPTRVTYKAGDLRARSWGFACPSPKQLSPNMTVSELFKFLLDKKVLDEVNKRKAEDDQESMENIKKWFTDFLGKLHDHILLYLGDTAWSVDWHSTKFEYIFSLPTSWELNDELVEDFREIVEQAGFGTEPNSSVTIELTEGVASAVYTAKSVDHNFNVSKVHACVAEIHADPKVAERRYPACL